MIKNKAFKNNSPFGAVNTKVPAIKDIDKNGTISYTMELKKSKGVNKLKAETDLYFDNFVINQKENGKENIHIIRYLPETTWYFQGAKSFSNYTGEIRIFDAQGKTLGKTRVKNGADNAQTDKAKAMTCTFSLNGTLCVGGMYGEPLSCRAIYEFDSCSDDTTGGETPLKTLTNMKGAHQMTHPLEEVAQIPIPRQQPSQLLTNHVTLQMALLL